MKYMGYEAKLSLDEESGMIFGEVIDTRDAIVFHGATIPEVKKAFAESIDLYLEACKSRNRRPDKPFNGVISYRTKPQVHRHLSLEAARQGVSVNQLVDNLVRRGIMPRERREFRVAAGRASAPDHAVGPTPDSAKPALEKRQVKAKTAAKMARSKLN